MTNNLQEIKLRWDNYTSKLEQRILDSFEQAKEACFEYLEENDNNYIAVLTTWSGMLSQIKKLPDQIELTWEEKVEPLLQGVSTSHWVAPSTISDNLVELIFRQQVVVEGQIAQQFYNHAIELLKKNQNCSQCDAAIQPNPRVFRDQYITCDYCQTTNTIAVDPKCNHLEFAVEQMVKHQLQSQYDDMIESCNDMNRAPKRTQSDLWTTYENNYWAYHKAYFDLLSDYSQHAQKRYEQNIARKQKELDNQKSIYIKK